MEDAQLVNDCREILSGPDHAGYLFGKCVRKTSGRFSSEHGLSHILKLKCSFIRRNNNHING